MDINPSPQRRELHVPISLLTLLVYSWKFNRDSNNQAFVYEFAQVKVVYDITTN